MRSLEERNRLIEANLDLPKFAALCCRHRLFGGPYSLEDLESAAREQLVRCAEMFEPAPGRKFRLFAIWRMKLAVRTFVNSMVSNPRTDTTFKLRPPVGRLVSQPASPEPSFEDRIDEIDAANFCLRKLKPADAFVIREHALKRRTFKDIAAEMNVTKQRVEQRYASAIERARRMAELATA